MTGTGSVPWDMWAKLASLDVGIRSRDAIEPVIKAAGSHDKNPKLRKDVVAAIDLVFRLAAQSLEAYQVHKLAHGMLDFADQEVHMLELLMREDIRQRLAGELDLVMVDEFQDTSPIQLAIFLQLAAIAGRSVWVGDQKQAIFGFRGTDPSLTDAGYYPCPRRYCSRNIIEKLAKPA